MAESWGDLFKWKRQTKPKAHHSRGNVQDWIKRVQKESEVAAREVFGNDYGGLLEQVHVDDDALVEAQDLLDSWINDKKLEDLRLQAEFSDERWTHTSSGGHMVKGHRVADDVDGRLYSSINGGLLTLNDELDGSFAATTSHVHHAKLDGFEEDLDEEIAVQKVIRDMLDKKVVDQHIVSDLGFNESKKRRNPLTKMELRHKQVKENSETRRKEVEQSKRERSARKEAEYLARQQLLKEEKEKQARAKKEEAAIQKEMARIRRVMENEKKLNKEQEHREQQKLQEAESLARQYLEQEERRREEKRRVEHEAKEEIRRQLLREMEEKAAQEAQGNKRILKKHFSAWYSVVVNQRIKLGKGRALADWRCKLRAWNAWRTFVHHVRSDKEAQAIQQEMKEKHRKERLAEKFHQQHLLRRSFLLWQRWVQQEVERKQLMDEHKKKADKMAALLQAAASGKLWSKPSMGDGNDSNSKLQVLDIENDEGCHVTDQSRVSTARRVDNIFDEPGRQAGKREKIPATGHPKRTVASVSQSTSNTSTNVPRHTQQAWVDQGKCTQQAWVDQGKCTQQAWVDQGKCTQQAWVDQGKGKTIKDRMPSQRSKQMQNRQNTVRLAQEKQRTYKQVDNVNDLYSPDRGQSTRIQSHRQRTYSEVDTVENLYSRASRGNVMPKEKTVSKQQGLRRFLSEEALNRRTGTANEDSVSESYARSDVDSGGTSVRSTASSRLISRAPVIKSAKAATKPLHLAMEERAKERAERKAVLEEKRRRAEEEKLALLKLQQEKQELELLKEKQEILRKKREEKRILREQELAKQQRIEKMKELNALADQHYSRFLLRKYGLSPWKQLILMSNENMSRAQEYYNISVVKHCFHPWRVYTQEQTEQREKAADLLYRWILLRRCWTSWRKYGQHMVRIEAVAEKYCATFLKKKYLRLWMNYVTDEQILYWEKERRADQHNEWRIKKRALIYWKKLIPLVRGEKEKEKRRAEMRKRVQTWLPDFKAALNPSP